MAIGLLIPATLTLVIAEVVDIGFLRISTLPVINAGNIIVVMLVEVNLGHKIPFTIPLEIVEQELILKGEIYIKGHLRL